MRIIKYIKENFFVIILIILSSFLFFYRLDYNTLASWDEAWYAEIAKQMVKTGDYIFMIWNGKPYYDHPPMGFWLMALSYKVFGISEFSTRLPSAIMGVLTILLMYKTSIELFGKKLIGFVAALILGTSVWYVIRVRSGNLESVFVFFFILTIYLSIKSSKNFKWFPLAMLSFGSLILSKTLVGVSAAPLILYLNFKQIINVKKNIFCFLLGLFFLFIVVYPWYHLNIQKYSDFYQYVFIQKGTRDEPLSSFFKINAKQSLFYINMGIRAWYKLWLLSIFFGIFGLFYYLFKFLRKRSTLELKKIFVYLFLFLWNFVILYPFLTSDKTELWHLIPTYLPVSLMISYFLFDIGYLVYDYIFKFVRSRFGKVIKAQYKLFFQNLYILVFILIAILQISRFWKEVFPQNKYIPDDVEISKRLSKYSNKEICVDISYLPIAVFYSGRTIKSLVYESDDIQTFTKLFNLNNGKVIGVTNNWVLEDLKKKKFAFKVLEKNNSYSIVTKPE